MAQTMQKTRPTASSLVRYQYWAWRGQHRKHSLIYCCVLYCAYIAVAWQCVDQIRYNVLYLFHKRGVGGVYYYYYYYHVIMKLNFCGVMKIVFKIYSEELMSIIHIIYIFFALDCTSALRS
jgi:hypothetical protein